MPLCDHEEMAFVEPDFQMYSCDLPAVGLGETAFVGSVDADNADAATQTRVQALFIEPLPCEVVEEPAVGDAPRIYWVRCEPNNWLDSTPSRALVEHTDGRYLAARLGRDDDETRALIRSLRPRTEPKPCGETCVVQHIDQVSYRAEGHRRLTRIPARPSLNYSIEETHSTGQRTLWIDHHGACDRYLEPEGSLSFDRKVWFLGEVYRAYRPRDQHRLHISAREPGSRGWACSILLGGRTQDDLERAVRMLAAANLGTDHAPEPRTRPHPGIVSKPDAPLIPRSRLPLGWWVALPMSLSMLLPVALLLFLRRRNASAVTSRDRR